jgi:hypothetical protein
MTTNPLTQPIHETYLTEEIIEIGYKICTGEAETFGNHYADKLFFAYLNDVNSSTTREALTAYGCNYKWLNGKLGFDAIDESTGEEKEIKPKLYTKIKSSGSGNFSDLTPKRIEKFKNKDFGMINSFFVNNRLAYILEFKFSDILPTIENQVNEKCIIGKNTYARSSQYNYVHYVNSPNLKFHKIDWDLITSTSCINKKFFNALQISYDKQFPKQTL